MDRATDSGSVGRGFEPLQARHPFLSALRRPVLVAGAISLVAALFLLVRAAGYEPAVTLPPARDSWHEIRLALHAHSDRSDGAKPPEAVADAARAAGLDVLMLTDHAFSGMRPAQDGWHDGLLFLVDEEVSTDAGHLLALAMQSAPYRVSPEPQLAVNDIHDRRGLALVAHPTNRRFGWRAGRPDGIDGIEVWNGDSSWRAASWWSRARALFLLSVDSRLALLSLLERPERELGLWDDWAASRPMVGVAAADAHGGFELAGRTLPWPSYAATMSIATNHLLLESPLSADLATARRQIEQALRLGRLFMALDALGDPTGFRFSVSQAGRTVAQGGSIDNAAGALLSVVSPAGRGVSTLLYRDGVEIAVGGSSLEVGVDAAGVYRAEARLDRGGLPGSAGLPWILSNPIRIGAETLASTTPPASHPDRVVLWAESARGGLRAEHDPRSSCRLSERGTGSVSYELEKWQPGESEVFCALTDRTPRDLSAFRGLSITVSGPERSAVQIQLRDTTATGDEVWWRRHVPISERGTRHELGFESFRPIQEGVERSLDRSRVQGIFVVVSQDVVSVSVPGKFTVERLALY